MRKRPSLLSGEDLPPAPRQKRSLERRARLKAAGLALFGEKGYERTSVDQIARRARLPVGTFYQHFCSKRQLLLVLMDDLLEKMSRLNLNPGGSGVREGLQNVLSRAFSADVEYLGAYRAWREASLSDQGLARKQDRIQAWTTGRVEALFERLHRLPGARLEVDVPALARVMDSFFWSLLARAPGLRAGERERWVGSAAHLVYHALFADPAEKPARH